jgi:tetratricopeptide (TPR) repeat protein
MLVTSRERLNLREEWLLEMHGLTFPQNGATRPLESYSAVSLFVQSARRVRPEFALSDADAPHVAQICRLVEGMPLAIELAATWVQILSCQEIAHEIQNNLDFLTTSVRNIPERHRSLRAVFEYSWKNLNAQEQASLSRLSVFRGGFRQEAAGGVAGASLHVLLALVGKSLLRRNIAGRFEMHELLRQYAEQKMTPDEAESARARHASYYAGFLDRQLPALRGPEEARALDEIQAEIDNIHSAWWTAAERRSVADLWKAAVPLFHFYEVRSSWIAGAELAQRTLPALDVASEDLDELLLMALLLAVVSLLHLSRGQASQRESLFAQSLALVRRFPGHPRTAWTLVVLGNVRNPPGAWDEDAYRLPQEALAICEVTGDRWSMAEAALQLGWAYQNHIRYEEAGQQFRSALAIHRALGNPGGIARALSSLAENVHTLGNSAGSRALAEEALTFLEQIGNRRTATFVRSGLAAHHSTNRLEVEQLIHQQLRVGEDLHDPNIIAWGHYNLGWIGLEYGDYVKAEARFERSLALFHELNDWEGASWSTTGRAMAANGLGDFHRARELAQASLQMLAEKMFPWGIAGAHYALGDSALGLGRLDEARRAYREAVRIAFEAQAVLQLLRHLSGIAELLLVEEEPERAVTLMIFLLEHQATSRDTRYRVERLLAETERFLPPESLREARERAAALTLDTAVTQALAEQPRSRRG